MPGYSARENREAPSTPVTRAGRLEKGMSPKSSMHVDGESDGRIVPANGSNKNGQPLAESLEGRRPTKENIEQPPPPRTQSRIGESRGLLGVREVATCGLTPHIQGRSRMQQFCTYGLCGGRRVTVVPTATQVWRCTEPGEAPRGQGATTENSGCI